MTCRSFPEGHFNQLLEFKKKNNPGLSNVCVPYVGRDWKDGPRVMICGKAPNGWDNPGNTSIEQCDNADTFINECLVPGDYRSIFWIYVWEVISACVLGTPCEWHDEQQRRQLTNHLYWTNLAKVGGDVGNLPEKLLRADSSLFTSILIGEIRRMAPRAVVFTTGSYGCDLIETIARTVAYGDVRWAKDNGDFWHYKPEESSPVLIWTRHPQGQGREARRTAARRIAELLKQ